MIAFILLVIGGLNWLAIGLFDWGVGDVLGGTIAKVVYILVGLSALFELFTHKSTCKTCSGESKMPMSGGVTGMTQ